ncbi:MAG: hypothetical protein HUU60_08250 [Armatimonadetes bacterium]|nr:hypothetical protein [Armatimonadota bacterium]
MSRIQFVTLAALTSLFAFLGGFAAVRLAPSAVDAQGKREKIVSANKFVLEDKDGAVRAELSNSFGDPILFFFDKEKKARAWWTLNEKGEPHIVFVDPYDKPTWKAP